MKANEAPEKLYFSEVDKGVLDIYSTKESDNEVEYIRKDAFIEKACGAYCKVCKMPNCNSNECKWIGDFKERLLRVSKSIWRNEMFRM